MKAVVVYDLNLALGRQRKKETNKQTKNKQKTNKQTKKKERMKERNA